MNKSTIVLIALISIIGIIAVATALTPVQGFNNKLLGIIAFNSTDWEEFTSIISEEFNQLRMKWIRAEERAITYEIKYNALLNQTKGMITKQECYRGNSNNYVEPERECWLDGDCNCDGVCDLEDYKKILQWFGKSCDDANNWCEHTDFNKNGKTDYSDKVKLDVCMQ